MGAPAPGAPMLPTPVKLEQMRQNVAVNLIIRTQFPPFYVAIQIYLNQLCMINKYGCTARRPAFGVDEPGTYVAGPPLSNTCLQALSDMLLLCQSVQTRQSPRPFYHPPDTGHSA